MRVVISRGYEHPGGPLQDMAKRSRQCAKCGRKIITRETVSNPNARTTWLPPQRA